MDHRVFVDNLKNRTHVWGVRRLYAAVREVFGVKGVAWLVFGSVVLLLPCLGLGCYGFITTRYALWGWCVLALLGYLAGSPNPTGIGMITCMALAATGLVMGIIYGLPHVVGGLGVGFTWLGKCCIQGGALQYLEEAIVESPDNFQQLQDHDNFLMVPR